MSTDVIETQATLLYTYYVIYTILYRSFNFCIYIYIRQQRIYIYYLSLTFDESVDYCFKLYIIYIEKIYITSLL